MHRIHLLFISLFFCATIHSAQGQTTILNGVLKDKQTGEPIYPAKVQVTTDQYTTTTPEGRFDVEFLPVDKQELIFIAPGYDTLCMTLSIPLGTTAQLDFFMFGKDLVLNEVQVSGQRDGAFELQRLRNVENMAIYASKKSERIQLESVVANLATNNARQIYKDIPGLNIWENDGAGLQLSIGARGLDPNRTSNFNTRQNGYDISADALGYPESYYTPPSQALQRIEIVRGAASLQYGPQFGGLLNFVLKNAPKDKPLEFNTENTIGSFGLVSTYNSLSGSTANWEYLAFYQRKQGNGWRPNSRFFQNNAFIHIGHTFSSRLKLGMEYTYMNYLAQQPGGLQDFEFQQNPRQSNRSRNWFDVRWNLGALNLDYQLSEKTKINSRAFYLHAQRQALGELGAINRPDPLRERDLIRGMFDNFGNETRLLHQYTLRNHPATFLTGIRYYQGHTTNQQGDANKESGPDFQFLNPDDLERSEYVFPSKNLAFFIENLFYLNEKWSISPGARFEFIRTASDGFFKERVYSGGQVLFEQRFEDQRENERSFLLLGLGISHKPNDQLEWYGNFSQNYRSINFSDLAVVNPNLMIDSLLKDERGYNADLGIRGSIKQLLRFDASVFYLRYADRIGISEVLVPDPAVVEKAVAFRTNIGNARILGLESFVELDVWRWINGSKKEFGLTTFFNLSVLHGRYISGPSTIRGNAVELIPPFSIKTGISSHFKNLYMAFQVSYVHQHFSDATNAEFVADATRGRIPSYHVADLSLAYTWKRFKVQSGVNNLFNSSYFTRRATAYPGPGIIPADGRNLYLTVGVKI